MRQIASNCHPQIFLFLYFIFLYFILYLISFTVQDCFLFRFVCIELVSLIWFLQIWVAVYVYGTMINWFTLIKKLMQTSIFIVSGSIINASTVHLNGIWHLIWRYPSKSVLGGHPVSSGHYSIPRGCLLNTGFTYQSFAALEVKCTRHLHSVPIHLLIFVHISDHLLWTLDDLNSR